MTITTGRLILRPWREEDAEALYKYASSPDVGPIAGWAPHPSVEYSREIIRTVFAADEIYAVVLKDTREPVGCCGLVFADDPQTGEAEIGYWIGKEYWGQGLIPEAAKALLQRAFRDLDLMKVWCVHYDGNTRSKRVCEKCVFRYHHTNRDIPSPLGDLRTEHCYLLTRSDFDSLQNGHI